MRILRDASPTPEICQGSVLALGNFDGLHRGHRAVIDAASARARELGAPAGLLTFEPHPRRRFRPELPALRLITLQDKCRLLAEWGLDFIRVIHFTDAFSRTSAQDFIATILQGRLRAAHIVTGEDYRFGHARAGDALMLKAFAASHGFGVTVCPPVLHKGANCSSTRIRAALATGDMDEAHALLGRPYHISGIVRHGDARGRTLGFPTANLTPDRLFHPAFGVYAVRAHLGEQTINGVANVGLRPTFGGTKPRLEVHLFDWTADIYGEHMRVEFAQFIRPEQRFSGIDELRAQIIQDCEAAGKLLKNLM
jgi:riboflavin kinase/FMN adenylyltransferase